MKESPEARKDRYAQELWRFIDVLRRAGNVVEEETWVCPEPDRERRWRFDMTLPEANIAIEIEGLGGRHQSMKGFRNDIEKYAEAFARGWNVLRVTRMMIGDGTALEILARRGIAVEARPHGGDHPA